MHKVQAKSILSARNGINIYRGCTHGCIYCDSRSACYQMGHAFEDVAVKANAPELLEDALRRKRRRCMVGTGSMCDPYLPLEQTTRLTRRCLEVIDRQGFGAAVLTKSDLLLRDLDVLKRINQRARRWSALHSPPLTRTSAGFWSQTSAPLAAARLTQIFQEECQRHGVLWKPEDAMAWLMEFEDAQAGEQLDLFL